MPSRKIPVYPLTDYVPPEIAELGIFVDRFEILNDKFDRPSGMHRHEHFELFWLQGPAVHFNDFERYEIPAGKFTFILVSPGQFHRWEGTDDIRGTLISFTSAFFDGREPPPGTLPAHGFVYRRKFPPLLVLNDDGAETISDLTSQCEREFQQRPAMWLELIRSHLHAVMIIAERAFTAAFPAPPASPRSHQLMAGFHAAIEENFHKISSVSGYARLLGVTPGHLNDTARALTQTTAGDLIRSRILLEARRLLFHSNFTVSEIAYSLGYDDPSYFTKQFRKATGFSPGDFRCSIRENYQLASQSLLGDGWAAQRSLYRPDHDR